MTKLYIQEREHSRYKNSTFSNKLRWRILPIQNGYDPSLVYGNSLEGRLRHVEVWQWRVAPAAIVAGEVIVWRTEVCAGDGNGSTPETPLGNLGCVAHYLIAPAA